MANEFRVRQNFVSGLIDDNPLSNSATTLNSTELAGLQAIDSTQHAALVLDPTGAGNGPEIVWVTAHTGSATSATIVRGREGTSGVQHASTISWVHVATRADFELIGTTADRPSGTGLPYKYQRYYDTDLGQPLIYDGTQWVQTQVEVATVSTAETTTSSSYTDLSTSGPAVTVLTGTVALVTISANTVTTTGTGVDLSAMGFAVSGATTLAAADARAGTVSCDAGAGNGEVITKQVYVTGLTAGNNTFTAKYKRQSGSETLQFSDRVISVQPLF